MSVRILFYIFILFIATSCQTDLDKLQGHWHFPYGDEYLTLDFEDSIVIINKNNPERYSQRKIIEIDNKLYVPAGHEHVSGYIYFSKDTLIISEELDQSGWMTIWFKQKESLEDLIKDFNNDKTVLIELDTNNNSKRFNFNFNDKKWAMISSGYPLNKKLRQDSIILQIRDIYASYTDINKYLETEKSRWDGEQFIIIINFHHKTPKSTLDSVLNIINRNNNISNIYKTTLNIDKGFIGLDKIR